MNTPVIKKVVFIIAKTLFRDEEYLEPKNILEKAGIRVVTASSERGECAGKIKAKVLAEISIGEISVPDFDAVIFVGGPGASQYFHDKTAHKIANDFSREGKLVCSICAAGNILAQAGVLKGKKATAFESYENDLKASGAIWTGKDVEIDGNIITANGPAAAKEFGEAIVKALT